MKMDKENRQAGADVLGTFMEDVSDETGSNKLKIEILQAGIAAIKNELQEHFAGGIDGEPAIRDSEAELLAATIWAALVRSVPEAFSRSS
jgi:hypothetical protein